MSTSKQQTASTFFAHACSERAATSGTVFHILLTFQETGVLSANMGMAECAKATCIMNHLQRFWRAFTSFYTKLKRYFLFIDDYSYITQKINLQNKDKDKTKTHRTADR